jgi:hypothetical protein
MKLHNKHGISKLYTQVNDYELQSKMVEINISTKKTLTLSL